LKSDQNNHCLNQGFFFIQSTRSNYLIYMYTQKNKKKKEKKKEEIKKIIQQNI
jgi:hypothetical protein